MPTRSIYSLASVTALALLLTGCASNYAARLADSGNYTAQPTRSEALNVAVAAGLTRCDDNQCKPIDDAPRSKLPAAYQGASNASIAGEVVDALTLAQGVGQVAGVVNVASGLGSVAGGLMTLGSFFAGPVPFDDPARSGIIIAWMPKSAATTNKQAASNMVSIIHQALKETDIPSYSKKVFKRSKFSSVELFAIGDGCVFGENPCFVNAHIAEPTQTQITPSWIEEEGPAYAWTSWRPGANSSDGFRSIRFEIVANTDPDSDARWPDSVDSRSYLRRVSAHLPEWAYIYSPPTKKHPYPAMFNDGEMLLFIEPLTNQANTKQTA